MDDLPHLHRARTAGEIRELDRRAIEETGIPGIVLMENAGRRSAEEAAAFLDGVAGRRIVLLCGRGNNGGDGFVIARHLHNAGAEVDVLIADRVTDALPRGDARTNLEVLRRMGIGWTEIVPPVEVDALGARIRKGALVVDALLGTGTTGAPRPPIAGMIEATLAAERPVLAVDMPSGLDADTGAAPGPTIRAELTVTFAAPKAGFTRGDGPAHTGRVVVVDIAIPRALYGP